MQKIIAAIIKEYLFIFATFVLLLSILIPTLGMFMNVEAYSVWFADLMSRSCNQEVDRSFGLFTLPIYVCARCLGIYMGTFWGYIFGSKIQFNWRIFLLAIALIIFGLLEKYLEIVQFIDYYKVLGFFSGVFIGLGLILSVSLVANLKINAKID